MQLLDLAPWDEITVIESGISIMTYAKAIKLLSALKASERRFDKVFIGEFKSPTFHTFCRNLDATQFYNLDDGVSTIELQREVFVNPGHRIDEDKGIRSFVKRKIKSYFSVKDDTKVQPDFNLFTCFDLTAHPGQTIVSNKYRYLSQKISKLRVLKDTAYFYGSSISEKGILSFESELNMLGMAATHYNERGRRLIYIPHRLDQQAKLSGIDALGVEVRRLDRVAEVEPLLSGEVPSEIGSFFSTALYTLSKIYSYDNVVSFRLPEHLLVSRREAIVNLYKEYARHMTVIDL